MEALALSHQAYSTPQWEKVSSHQATSPTGTLNFECAGRSLFWVCMCLSRCFFVLDGKMVNFNKPCSTVLTFFASGNDADEALSSWKMDILLWNEKIGSLFVIFGTSR
jgi:hypothetical protein